jgi:serine/threonine protein kinase
MRSTRSDVFSMGILLYEMATGQTPFDGDSAIAILSAIMKDDPAPQLVRVADGTNAWSASIDRDLDDVFAIQSEIASQVVASIDASLVASSDSETGRTDNLEAYDFLKARQYSRWGLGPSLQDLERAASLLTSALALDEDFAQAHAELSLVHSAM